MPIEEWLSNAALIYPKRYLDLLFRQYVAVYFGVFVQADQFHSFWARNVYICRDLPVCMSKPGCARGQHVGNVFSGLCGPFLWTYPWSYTDCANRHLRFPQTRLDINIHILLFLWTIKCICIWHHASAQTYRRFSDSLSLEIHPAYSQYQCCYWPGNTRSQVINSDGIFLFRLNIPV